MTNILHLSALPPSEKAQYFLDYLCVRLPTRRVGSAGNQDATAFTARVLESLGYQVETPMFRCLDWQTLGASCRVDSASFPVESSPFSRGCDVTAPLRAASSLEELQTLECRGEVLLLHGNLASEQLMPKNFTFYNPENHQLIIARLEQKAPAAIISATGRNPELAGAANPFPLIEDGDFDIPSVYTTDVTGAQLAALTGRIVHLLSRAERIPSTGSNVVASRDPFAPRKVVVCAHIDTKMGTPGALDNAAGVITLLLAAELLRAHDGDFTVEFLVMNGEDYYGANGEKLYLEHNPPGVGNICLFINMDGLGYVDGRTAFSFYNLPEALHQRFARILSAHPAVYEGEQWYQGDHSIMVMNGVPTVAVTTDDITVISQEVTHTEKDVPALVDVEQLVEASIVVRDLILSIDGE